MPMMVGVPELPLGSGLISGLTPSGLISGLTPFVCRLEPPPVGSSTNWEKSMGKGTSACPLGFPALNVVIKFFSWVIFRDFNARKCGQHQSIKTLFKFVIDQFETIKILLKIRLSVVTRPTRLSPVKAFVVQIDRLRSKEKVVTIPAGQLCFEDYSFRWSGGWWCLEHKRPHPTHQWSP